MTRKRIVISVTDKEYQEYKEMADAVGIPLASFAKMAVTEYLEQKDPSEKFKKLEDRITFLEMALERKGII